MEDKVFSLRWPGSFNALARPQPINKHFSTLHDHLDQIPIPQNTDLRERIAVYDQQIGEGNAEGNARVQTAIDDLVAQTRTIERAVAALDLGDVTIEGSDSLDNVDAVFQ